MQERLQNRTRAGVLTMEKRYSFWMFIRELLEIPLGLIIIPIVIIHTAYVFICGGAKELMKRNDENDTIRVGL